MVMNMHVYRKCNYVIVCVEAEKAPTTMTVGLRSLLDFSKYIFASASALAVSVSLTNHGRPGSEITVNFRMYQYSMEYESADADTVSLLHAKKSTRQVSSYLHNALQ